MKRATTSLMFSLVAAIAALFSLPRAVTAQPRNPAPLQLEATISLGDVRGRIDHMAADPDRHRLFVAELGNDTVGVVDVEQRKTWKVIPGLKEPQGVGYLRATETLYVANGGDGSLRLYHGPDYAGNGRIDLGSDADNVRVDQAHQQIVVGYGSGALAIIDAAARSKVAEIPLRARIQKVFSSTLAQIEPTSTFPMREALRLSICRRGNRLQLGRLAALRQISRWRSTANRSAYW
jgi:YVTN family beta-propeller protein